MSYQPMPSGPPQGTAPSRGPAPSTVVNAVRLMFVSAGLSLIGLITEFALKNQIRDELRKSNPAYDTKRLDDLLNTTITIAVILGAILLVLYVLLAFQVRKGKNWARIVTWVFAGLGALSLITTIFSTAPALSRVLGIIGGLIDIGLIVLLAMAPSNAYFRKPQASAYQQYPPQGYPQQQYPQQQGYPQQG